MAGRSVRVRVRVRVRVMWGVSKHRLTYLLWAHEVLLNFKRLRIE